jgi:hypothetical protein
MHVELQAFVPNRSPRKDVNITIAASLPQKLSELLWNLLPGHPLLKVIMVSDAILQYLCERYKHGISDRIY